VFEDELALAIMDLYPQARGHTLVLPKAPARTLMDIEPSALSELMVRVQRVARGVREALQATASASCSSTARPGGQTVFHLHFHIIPRMAGQALSTHGSGGRADPAELADLARRIAAAI
jgi:histidine triad (HIT) family protein